MKAATPSWPPPAESVGHGQLAGRVALVTGSGRNLGRAIAVRLAAEGATVIVNDVDETGAKQVAKEIVTAGGHAVPTVGDMSDVDEVDRVFAEAESACGVVDVLVNNAYARGGESAWGPFLTIRPADWQTFLQANMTMLFACTQRAARAMAHAGIRGAIVNISSHGAARAHRNHIPYDSVKGATESFTRATAVDLAPWGIRVNALRPGSIAVEGEAVIWDGKDDLRAAQIPLGRAGSPGDVAASVLFLASPESAYVTGQVFNVDGGMSSQARAPQVEGVPVATPATIGSFPATLGTPATTKRSGDNDVR